MNKYHQQVALHCFLSNFISSHRKCSVKKGVLRNLTVALKKDQKTYYFFLKIINVTVDSIIVTVDLTLAQPSNRGLWNCWFAACTIVNLTLVEPLNQCLYDRQIAAYATVYSTLVKKEFILFYFRDKNC